MLRKLPKLLLAATAFAPVLFTYAAVCFFDHNYGVSALLCACAVWLLLFCLRTMERVKLQLSPQSVVIKSIKPADKELVGFILAYLLPLARGSGFETLPLIIALGVFFLVVMTSNAYHTNPLLGLVGYHFYEVVIADVGYVLVTRRNLHNTTSIKQVVSLTDYMLLDTKS